MIISRMKYLLVIIIFVESFVYSPAYGQKFIFTNRMQIFVYDLQSKTFQDILNCREYKSNYLVVPPPNLNNNVGVNYPIFSDDSNSILYLENTFKDGTQRIVIRNIKTLQDRKTIPLIQNGFLTGITLKSSSTLILWRYQNENKMNYPYQLNLADGKETPLFNCYPVSFKKWNDTVYWDRSGNYAVYEEQNTIYLMKQTNGMATSYRLITGSNPALSYYGTNKMVYANRNQNYIEIYLYDLLSGKNTLITRLKPNINITGIEFSYDNKRIMIKTEQRWFLFLHREILIYEPQPPYNFIKILPDKVSKNFEYCEWLKYNDILFVGSNNGKTVESLIKTYKIYDYYKQRVTDQFKIQGHLPLDGY